MHTLEGVVEAFELWRLEHVNKSSPIPDKLWVMAKTLIPNYKKSHILRALRLSSHQFNKHCISYKEQPKEIEGKQDCFAVGTFQPERSLNHEVCELTLKGEHKSLQIKINIQNITSILPLLEGYL